MLERKHLRLRQKYMSVRMLCVHIIWVSSKECYGMIKYCPNIELLYGHACARAARLP